MNIYTKALVHRSDVISNISVRYLTSQVVSDKVFGNEDKAEVYTTDKRHTGGTAHNCHTDLLFTFLILLSRFSGDGPCVCTGFLGLSSKLCF